MALAPAEPRRAAKTLEARQPRTEVQSVEDTQELRREAGHRASRRSKICANPALHSGNFSMHKLHVSMHGAMSPIGAARRAGAGCER